MQVHASYRKGLGSRPHQPFGGRLACILTTRFRCAAYWSDEMLPVARCRPTERKNQPKGWLRCFFQRRTIEVK